MKFWIFAIWTIVQAIKYQTHYRWFDIWYLVQSLRLQSETLWLKFRLYKISKIKDVIDNLTHTQTHTHTHTCTRVYTYTTLPRVTQYMHYTPFTSNTIHVHCSGGANEVSSPEGSVVTNSTHIERQPLREVIGTRRIYACIYLQTHLPI